MASHEDESSKDFTNVTDTNRKIIQTDRIKRLQILDYLWKMKRTGEVSHVASQHIMEILNTTNINETHFHLDTLKDLGLVTVDFYSTDGRYNGIDITGLGTTRLEDFFLEIDIEVRNSKNTELQQQIQEIDRIDDVYMKHEKYITTMTTIQEVFVFGNKILTKLGLS